MVGGQENRAVRQRRDRAMPERGPVARRQTRPPSRRLEPAVVRNPAEGYHHAQASQQAQLGLQVRPAALQLRSEEHTSELQSQSNLVCRLLLEKKKSNGTDEACT